MTSRQMRILIQMKKPLKKIKRMILSKSKCKNLIVHLSLSAQISCREHSLSSRAPTKHRRTRLSSSALTIWINFRMKNYKKS